MCRSPLHEPRSEGVMVPKSESRVIVSMFGYESRVTESESELRVPILESQVKITSPPFI